MALGRIGILIDTGLPKETEEENEEEKSESEAQAEEASGNEEQPKAEESSKQEELPAAVNRPTGKKGSKKKTEEEREFDKKLRKVFQDIQKYDPNWEEKSRLFGKDPTMDEVKNQIGEGASDNEIEELYEQIQKEQERERILKYILNEVADSIRDQARKRPDDLVSPYKARKINELLVEVRVRYEGSGYEDLLELVEEPGNMNRTDKSILPA